jgi:TRAP transporter TAXI family solute receptor
MSTANAADRRSSVEDFVLMKKSISLGLAVIITGLVGPVAAAEKPDSLTIMSGRQGGSWYGMGAGLAKIFIEAGVKASPEVGGGISNVAMVGVGRADMGFSMTIVPRMARLGMAPFKQKFENIYAIAQLAPSVVHIVVSEDSGVTSVKDLKGKPFATQPVGNVTTEAFKAVLAVNGLSESDLELTRGGQGFGAKEMKDRRIVGYTATTSPPSPSFADVSQSLKVRFLEIDDETFAAMKKENPGFSRDVIPAGTYNGQDKDIKTANTAMTIVASDNMSEAHAYFIAKTLSENIEQMNKIHKSWSKLTVKDLASVSGVDLHPGAAKYYREVGAIK